MSFQVWRQQLQFLAELRKKFNNVELFDRDSEDYQREAVQFLTDNPRSALFIDTGLGKTAICLRLIRDLVDSVEVNKVLIIAPLKVQNKQNIVHYHTSHKVAKQTQANGSCTQSSVNK